MRWCESRGVRRRCRQWSSGGQKWASWRWCDGAPGRRHARRGVLPLCSLPVVRTVLHTSFGFVAARVVTKAQASNAVVAAIVLVDAFCAAATQSCIITTMAPAAWCGC